MRVYKDKEIQIFKAAWEHITQEGYHETTISRIAKAAGVGKGTVYEYFSSKEELVASMVVYNLETAGQQVAAALEKASSPEEKLRILGTRDIEKALGMMQTMKLLQTLKGFDQCNVREEVFRLMRERYLLVEEILIEGMAAGDFDLGNAAHGAMLFMGTLNNTLMRNHFGGDLAIDPFEVLEFVIERLKK
ncbi:MAG: hypothetical protein AVO33_07460 [delta proteobacterium ML8_F1]|nr:MAG: hypothetical protein AVO33_07460 [delta proteobacterium ML8_F1]